MFDFVESYFEMIETFAAELDYIYNHTDKIDHDVLALQEAIGIIQDKIADISTWLYILAGLGALILALQVVILVKLCKKSNTDPKRKQLPAPKEGEENNGENAE